MRYSEITFATPIHGMGGMSMDCFVASDGYIILRSEDRLDVLLHNERTHLQCIIPWGQVRKAVPAETQVIEAQANVVDVDDDEPPTAVDTPAAKKRGGWPKGKARGPKEASDG